MSGLSAYSLQETRSLGMTRQLGQAIELLKFNNKELAAFLEFHAALNHFLQLERPSGPDGRNRPPKELPSTGAAGMVELAASAPSSLVEHVRGEIGLVLRRSRDLAIAEHFIEALEPSGWLGAPLEDIERSAGCSREEAETVLGLIQQIDPPGLFARSLAECLRLQAMSAEELSPEMACLLDNLPLLARGEIDELAKLCGADRKTIVGLFEKIRTYNPKPGASFDQETPVTTAPDLLISKDGGSWQVELNRSALPALRIVERDGLSKEDKQMLELAHSVARAVERRNITTIRIAAEIVQRQTNFMKGGATELLPLSHRDIAAALGMHETTVSRVTMGLRVQTPFGTIALRDFFGAALAGEKGNGSLSNKAVQARIAAMIRDEDSRRPMSDQVISNTLGKEGIQVARRTVAKYRELLRIPSASDRSKQGRLKQARRS